MTQEKKLILVLIAYSLCILVLVTSLTLSLKWSGLAISSILLVLCYPLIFLNIKLYHWWRDSLIQLTTYTQSLKNGQHTLRLKKQHPNNLITHLHKQIDELAQSKQSQYAQQQGTKQLLDQILETWPIPVCLFDHNLTLSYSNTAMRQAVAMPMLMGTSADQLGFVLSDNQLKHHQFVNDWQTQTIIFEDPQQNITGKHWLFSAVNITEKLNETQRSVQQNLVRVLSHEIRNSLTPMQSMTDTLLQSDTLDIPQTRMALNRINQRSKRLLNFIDSYSKLSQLPKAQCQWFDVDTLVKDVELFIQHTSHSLEVLGETRCFGDIGKLSQVIINLVKNAIEANSPKATEITLTCYTKELQQIIEVSDNGPGFNNLDHATLPFYTTKQQGEGIGLALCSEIIASHGGWLAIQNSQTKGAKVIMQWPTP